MKRDLAARDGAVAGSVDGARTAPFAVDEEAVAAAADLMRPRPRPAAAPPRSRREAGDRARIIVGCGLGQDIVRETHE